MLRNIQSNVEYYLMEIARFSGLTIAYAMLRKYRRMFASMLSPNSEAGSVANFSVADGSQIPVHPDSKNPTYCWEKLQVNQTVIRPTPLSPDTPVRPDHVRFVCVSDTHNRTSFPNMINIPEGDVLLHGGDFSMVGAVNEVKQFNEWLGTLPHKRKIVIAGNHDLIFDEELSGFSRHGCNLAGEREKMKKEGISHAYSLLTNCIYLQDAEIVVAGIRIYGSPWQPEFGGWGFNLERGQDCLDKWNLIPENIDVLMTHGPPIGHGDLCRSRERAGCVELLHTIQYRVKPKYHIFGHIHEDPGMTSDGTTSFINACTCNLSYRPKQSAIVFDLPLPEGVSKDDIQLVPGQGISQLPHDSSVDAE